MERNETGRDLPSTSPESSDDVSILVVRWPTHLRRQDQAPFPELRHSGHPSLGKRGARFPDLELRPLRLVLHKILWGIRIGPDSPPRCFPG